MPLRNWFVGGTYEHKYFNVSAQRCVNWFPARLGVANERAPWILLPTPGLRYFTTLDLGAVRGLFHRDGRVWAVGGNGLYEVLSNGTTILRGAIATDSNPATLCSNGDAGHQVAISSGDKAYILDMVTNVLTTVLTSGATMLGFVDGFFLALDAASSKLQVSAVENGLTWDSLDVGQRSVAADRWKAMVVGHREAWMIGSATSEVWQNTGNTNEGAGGFAYYQAAGLIPHGTAAPWSAAMCGGVPIWLQANDEGQRMVLAVTGAGGTYAPQRISTDAIDDAIEGYATISDAVAWSYAESGHAFYLLNFPTECATWVYDLSTGMWHERGTWNVERMAYDAWRPQYHCVAWGKHLVGDRSTGVIYEMTDDIHVDIDGAPLRRLRRSPYIAADGRQLFHDQLKLICEPGAGNPVSPEDDPVAVWRWSDDGAKTWSMERPVGIGRLGEYERAAVITRLGQSRARVYELVVSDPVPWPIVDCALKARPGVA